MAFIPSVMLPLPPLTPCISEDEGVSEVVNVGDGIEGSVILEQMWRMIQSVHAYIK